MAVEQQNAMRWVIARCIPAVGSLASRNVVVGLAPWWLGSALPLKCAASPWPERGEHRQGAALVVLS